MKIYNEIIQGTPEWFEIRKWKLTASNAQAIWNCWKWLDAYIIELMSEFYSSWEKINYTNPDIERWKELEKIACSIYELEKNIIVEQVWFIEMNEYVWCSPDGLIWNDGLIEIKAVNDKNHFLFILNWEKEIESKYIWQMQMQLLITSRKWCDYVSYNPNYKQSLIIHRILPDLEVHKKLLIWFEVAKQKIEEIKKKLTNYK